MTLTELRRERNMKQEELAHALGVSQQTISLYEKGRRIPSAKNLKKLADYLNLPMGDVYGLLPGKG